VKIAVLSDTIFPTAATFPGHGLGTVNLAIAEGLLARGHSVTLFAGFGSEFAGPLVMKTREQEFYTGGLAGFDALLDGGHEHGAALAYPDAPVVNLSHDRERPPGRCAVFVSAAHRAFHKQPGRVIYNGIDVEAFMLRSNGPGDYLAFLALMMAHKGPLAALQVARLSGVPLTMAGPGTPPHGATYVGALVGAAKLDFLANARALLVPAGIESGGLTCLEAAACGTPVIAFDLGGLPEYVCEGVTGFLVPDIDSMAGAVARVGEIVPEKARAWVAAERSLSHMMDDYERALQDVARGERW
jgi:glycosyltransferase involved in cell wall biosynthesis